MATDYTYLRPVKAAALQRWYDSGFYKKDRLNVETYKNAVILPLMKKSGDQLQFGKGGVVFDNKYIESSGIENRVGDTTPLKTLFTRIKK